MGLLLSTYSRSELNRISTPGKVVPALFWLIPIGNWDPYELERLWNHFTRERSMCQELGLMLVKNKNHRDYDYNNSTEQYDLSDLNGKLSDLLPSGIRTIYDDKYLKSEKNKNQVLILSGSYPQPGWGVLTSLINFKDIEILLKNTLNNINPISYSIFNTASNSFKEWKVSINEKPIKGDTEILIKKQNYCVELYNILENLLKEIQNELLNSYHYHILKNIYTAGIYKEFSDLLGSLFENADDKFILSLSILKSSKDINESEINSTLERYSTEYNSKTNNLFKSEKNEQLKKVAGLLLKLNEDDRPKKMFLSWSKNIFDEKINKINAIVQDLKTRFNSFVGELTLSINHLESSYSKELNNWQNKVEQHRLIFHKNLQEVLKSHLECGPAFLLHLEKLARLSGKSAKSVSWDPPRMVGWKILTEGIQIARFDITTLLKEMIPEFSNQVADDSCDDDTLVNGSLFTDYVHYISKSDSNLSSRNATKNLLEKLMRSGEIKTILENYLTKNIPSLTHSQMVETLLVEFGWPTEKDINEKKLAECFEVSEGKFTINKLFSGNDIRIICESYCKDLVDTLSSIIGYTEKELLNLIMLRHPEYKSQNKGWNYEISKMTIGSAIYILSALLNEALPDKKVAAENLIKNLRELSKKLNPLSHHPPVEIDTLNLVDEIFNIMNYTKELVSEMPWHFYPVQRNGHQPTVLTGDAWCHSHKQNRQLSIILWSNENDSESMLVWNPNKVNPVIPDGIIIKRP